MAHRHRSQHDKAHTRYLEHKRDRLVRELAAVNRELRQRTPTSADEHWDFDPRTAEIAHHG